MRKCFHLFAVLTLSVLALVAAFLSSGLAAEKIQFASAVKVYHPYYLPVLAAEEKGLWAQNGLEAEWVTFRSVPFMLQAVAGGSINIGVCPIAPGVIGVEKGLPAKFVSVLQPFMETFVWVLADSPIKEVKDLKGKKIGVPAIGSIPHVFGQVIVKRHGLEKEVRFVGAGGLVEGVAALVAKGVDAYSLAPIAVLANLLLEGKVRQLTGTRDFVPREWADHGVIARNDYIRNKPEQVKRVVKAFHQGVDFVLSNRAWSIEKIKSMEMVSDKVAAAMFEYYPLSRDGRIDRKAMENVRNFLIEYGLLSADKAPPVDELYMAQFTQ